MKTESFYIENIEGNDVFHIALDSGGKLQPIVCVKIPFNSELLKSLLQTDRPGGRFYRISNEGGYFFTFDNNRKRPYPSVMIWKYRVIDGQNTIQDMEQEDLAIIPYAVKNYLLAEEMS